MSQIQFEKLMARKMKNRIEISIIPFGLRQEETVVQIAVTMNHLETIIQETFQGIKSNIEKRKHQLSQLQSRSGLLNDKLNVLTGKNVATTIFAASKFPAKEDNYERHLILSFSDPKLLSDIKINSKFVPSKYYKFSNKLQFYHVKNSAPSNQGKENPAEEGLGNLPVDLDSVNSLILFNTSENLYKEYIQLDPLDVFNNHQQVIMEEADTNVTIAAAPNSILHNYVNKNNNDYFNCFYTPAFQEIPSIDVPQDLPDLPGIAEDLKFSNGVENSGTPTVNSGVKKNYASPVVKEGNNGKVTNGDSIISIDAKIVVEPSVSKYLHLPGEQQSLKNNNDDDDDDNNNSNSNNQLDADSKKIHNTNGSSLTPNIPPPPPPPPLPPPFPLSIPSEQVKSHDSNVNSNSSQPEGNLRIADKKKELINSSFDVHSNLMEAIRKAGGRDRAKLRPVSDDIVQQNDIVQNTTKPSKSESFMEDLYAKLALRRKGISGQIKDNKNGNILDKMSAIISPSPPDDSEKEDENDAEWDD